jgi:lysozyme family protein
MADFEIAYKKVMEFEGGYSNNPNDPGSETYKGIARNFWPQWQGWKSIDAVKDQYGVPDIQALSDDAVLGVAVQSFYLVHFWNPILGSQILFQEIADELFDSAVNCGINQAIKFLQLALTALSNRMTYSPLVADGKLGPKTWTALTKFCAARPKSVPNLVKALNILQGAHYLNLAIQSDQYRTFIEGWLKRVELT